MNRLLSWVVLMGFAAGPALAQVQQSFPGVPPPVPSPPPLALPQRGLVTPPPAVTPQPRTGTFNDRVIRCNLAFPNAGGLGHNPTDRDSFVRHCVN